MRIKQFKDLAEENSLITGGKGASLSKMAKAGFNIPEGFVICSDVFNNFLVQNNIKDKINNLLWECNIDDNSIIEEKSKLIKELIKNSYITNEIQNGILQKFKELDTNYVAVRSSATSEDGNTSAWAGQLETYLNVTEKYIIDNVKKCWASIFNPRAIFYKVKKNDISDVLVAVVIQEMIQSEVSGVAFSVNPVNNENEIIIEAVLGLGEAIVSGTVTPDIYIVDETIDKKIRTQEKMIQKSKENLNEWINVPEEIKDKQKLNDNHIAELSKTIKNIEKYYGYPVDVEWGIQNNKIYILQCRPITTIKENVTVKIMEDIKKLGNWNYYVSRKFNWFLEMTQVHASSEKEQNELLGFNVATKNNMILNGDEYYQDSDFENNCKVFKRNFDNNNNFFEEFAKKEFEVVKETKEYIEKIKRMNFEKLSKDEIFKNMSEFNRKYIRSFIPGYTRPEGFLEIEFKERLKKELKLEKSEIEDIFEKISTCPNYDTLAYSEEPLNLLKIAKQAKDGDKGIDKLIEKHVQKYAWIKSPVGYETTEFTKDEYIRRLKFLENENIDNKIDNIIKARKNNDIEYENILKKYNFTESLLKMIKAIRDFIFLRTYTTEYSDYLFYTGRKTIFSEIAKRCKIDLDDIIMFDCDEILEIIKSDFIVNNLKIVSERKKGFAILWLQEDISTYFGDCALELQAEVSKLYKNNCQESEEDIITGTPANKGKITGKVKILLEYEDIFNVEKGDIIVATMTTPDYVSAMEKAVGFVTDEGGITCHAAILSREFNVPCIVGTNNATQKLKNGQLIELDAYNGVIRILE